MVGSRSIKYTYSIFTVPITLSINLTANTDVCILIHLVQIIQYQTSSIPEGTIYSFCDEFDIKVGFALPNFPRASKYTPRRFQCKIRYELI